MPPRSPRHRPVDGHIIAQDAIDPVGSVQILSETLSPMRKLSRGTTVTLDIPLDEPALTRRQREEEQARAQAAIDDAQEDTAPSRLARASREPRRRDSLKRREALLKGKEGSRRRQKWENDRLIGNPWAEQPDATDWEPRPTHPVQNVPYFLAPLWDERKVRVQMRAAETSKRAEELRKQQTGNMPKDLRDKLKRSRGAKGLLQDLEEQVREFVKLWEEKTAQLRRHGLDDADSSEDEEIVFVGRNGATKSPTSKTAEDRLARERLIFDSLVNDHGASFGRWLVHAIGDYYELDTWSRTTGNPARREAYVSIGQSCRYVSGSGLPTPLYGLV